MTKFTEQFNTAGSEIRMSTAERSRIYMKLRDKMHAGTKTGRAVPSPFFIRSPFFARTAVAFVLVVMVSGGTAFAAEGTLPGDPLYGVKVGAVEPIEGALQFSNTAKAAWNAKIATRRLDEAQALASRGQLTDAASQELAANFNEHASAVTSAAETIENSDPSTGSDIATNFSASVAERGAAILVAGSKSKSTSSARASGSLVVAISSDEDSANHEPAPTAAMKTSLAPQTDAQAAQLSVAAHAALSAANTSITSRALAKNAASAAKAKAASIANHIVKADAELSIGSTSEAVDGFNRALRDIDTLTQSLSGDNENHTNAIPSVPSLQH